MIDRIRILILVAALSAILVVSGCTKKPEGDSTSTGAAPTASETTGAPNGDSKEPTAMPALDVSTVPAELKHEGYQLYGLDHGKPIEYEVTRSDTGEKTSGTASTKLVANENGVARFVTERTGALSELGAEEVEARKDGIYNTKIGGKAVEPVQLVMPAELPNGKAWSTKSSVKLDTGTVEEDLTFKAVGVESIKTKAGTFDAMKVTASGQFKMGADVAKAGVTAYYVKGIGTVKMSIVRTDSKGKTLTMTVEATKVD